MTNPLAIEFQGRASQKGFSFKLLKREDNVAIYQKDIGDGVMYYEVVIVKHHNGLTFGDTHRPPSEFYPGDNQFGETGWCYRGFQIEEAEKKFQELLTQLKPKS